MTIDAVSSHPLDANRPQRSHNEDARCISIIRSPLLRGQSQYLGGLSHGPYIYFIPGHAKRLLVLDSRTDICYHVGPILEGQYKWLRATNCAKTQKMYGLPCHSNRVLRVDPFLVERILEEDLIPSQQVAQDPPPPVRFYRPEDQGENPESLDWAVTVLEMPTRDCQEDEKEEELLVLDVTASSSEAECNGTMNDSSSTERYHKTTLSPYTYNRPWKYHGGVQSPSSGLIFLVPQFATRILCIDPHNDTVRLVGPIMRGRYKYYGALLGRDGCIYGIPQSATSVVRVSPDGNQVTFHGNIAGEHKWHGGSCNADMSCIYGVPCNADTVIQIRVPTSPQEEPQVALLGDANSVQTGRHRDDAKYKYLGAVRDKAGGVYFLPSGAERVLMVTPSGDAVRPVGPNLYLQEDICQNKWQNGFSCGGEILYGIPLSGNSILRIRPRLGNGDGDEPEVDTFGYGTVPVGLSKWEGCVETSDGQVAYAVPDNCKAILKIMPHLDLDTTTTAAATTPEGTDSGDNQEDSHGGSDEDGRKHDDTGEEEEKKNHKESNLDSSNNDKSGGADVQASETATVGATTTQLASDANNTAGDDKDEEKKEEHLSGSDVPHDDDGVPTLLYTRGVPTVRSSAHRVRYSDAKSKGREKDQPHAVSKSVGGSNKDKLDVHFSSCLPPSIREVRILTLEQAVELRRAVTKLLQSPRIQSERVGWWAQSHEPRGKSMDSYPLEHFRVPSESLSRGTHGGHCEETSRHLSEVVATDDDFLGVFDDFVVRFILPHLKTEMAACGLLSCEQDEATFYYQRPPTLRLQPGPSSSLVLPHRDSIYGHQDGEVNFWIPLTDNDMAGGTHLHVESLPDRGDYAAAKAKLGQVVRFHGSFCRHYVPCNTSKYTRVSLDFRVGLGDDLFDASWQMLGTRDDHTRRRVAM